MTKKNKQRHRPEEQVTEPVLGPVSDLPPDAEDMCLTIAGHIGVGGLLMADERLRREAMRSAEARFKRDFGKTYKVAMRATREEAQLILRRCFLWALTDDVLTDRVREALKGFGVERQEEVFSRIKSRLLPPEDDSDGAYFDPGCWSYGDVGANLDDQEEALACLGLFRIMMRFQERGFARKKMPAREVANIIATMRNRAARKRTAGA